MTSIKPHRLQSDLHGYMMTCSCTATENECSCDWMVRGDLNIDRRVSLSLQGGMQALLFHAGLHSDQDGLDLPGALHYTTPHLSGTCAHDHSELEV